MNQIVARLTGWLEVAAERMDLVLAATVVAIIFMMVLPLPLLLVDILIGLNMGMAAVLLMVAMYIPSPLSFSSFPAVLLVSTLFRLGLSIATTRLILLQGDAGHIIDTFGNFVVGGNLVVGLVVFLILTIVQFIVITKGTERVAEVSARFSLDAMPGKQMSIDGDMRAGAIDMNEARRRRALVEKESQMYGAMDGAMKFVKGDAVASLIIVGVNLIGGLLIGVMQRNLDVASALKKYAVLSVGDGLIAQIPALFISICAGIIVTRVSGEDGKPTNVGKDIGRQLLGQPKSLLIGAAVMLGFAIVPGMPTAVFLSLAVVFGVVGWTLLKQEKIAQEGGKPFSPGGGAGEGASAGGKSSSDAPEFAPTLPLLLDLAQDLQAFVRADGLNQQLVGLRRTVYSELGVSFPAISIRFTEAIRDGQYIIRLHEIPVAGGRIRPQHVLVNEQGDTLRGLGIDFVEDAPFLPQWKPYWVPDSSLEALHGAGLATLDALQILSHHVGHVMRRYAGDFMGIQEAKFLLSSMEEKFPDLVKEVQRVMPIQKVAELLQRLVAEDVSIRNLRAIFEAIIDWGQKEKDTVMLAEYLRSALKRQISHKFADANNTLSAYLFSSTVEETLRASIRQTSAGSYLALDPQVSRQLVESVKRTVGDLRAISVRPVLLTSMDVRRYVRKLIEQDCYELPVISHQELTPEIRVQPLAKIELH